MTSTANPPTRILLVDDEKAIRRNFRSYLEDGGYAVSEASDGQAALDIFDQVRPAVVITDLRMPGLDGKELLARLKEVSPETPVVVVSGTGTIRDAIDAIRLGAADYILKPLQDAEELEVVIQRTLQRQRLAEEIRQHREHLEELVSQRTCELRRLMTAVEQTSDTIIITDTDGNVLYVNDSFEKTTGYLRAEILGRTPRLLKSDHNDPALYEELWRTIKAGQIWRGELVNRKKDGALYTEGMVITPVRDKEGAVVNFIACKRDLTEQKKLEAQILRMQRVESVGRLANGVAHDLNNILAPVLMTSDLLREKLTEPGDLEMLDLVASSAKRGAEIVNQLLMFSRGATGAFADLDLAPVIRETVRMIRETFPKSIAVQVETAENLWHIKGDATQIHQVLLNLCVNARDAMPDGGTLSLAAENLIVEKWVTTTNPEARPGSYTVIQVSDTGTGIPANVLDKIFDPFFTTKELGKGSGLGLSTVLGIARGHEGFIEVQTQLGRGTQFKVYLPALHGDLPELRAPDLPPPTRGGGELILLVDDEEALRKTAARFLAANGYRVIEAADGYAALALYVRQKNQCRAVLVDLWMPYMDGLETIRQLRKMNPDVSVVAMSGLPGLEAEAKRAGVSLFLPKPWTSDALLRILSQALG
jgi:PAS domain S-box-containing protein